MIINVEKVYAIIDKFYMKKMNKQTLDEMKREISDASTEEPNSWIPFW